MSSFSNFSIPPASGLQELNRLWEELDRLEAQLSASTGASQDFLAEHIERVQEKIHAFEPSVSILGQVKAGKSTLLNALIGQRDLLPSDVNPWTSVITGVHLNSRYRPAGTRALFRFFDALEWDRLVETGGRLGEMADRAGFAGEATEIRAQVMEMRQATEGRLGSDFHKLLGSSHAYPEFSKALINRYICYGDPDELALGSAEGVYADITKTADLYLDLPHLPRGLCLRDTPGVNDTFMMREQITLNAISESRVCVIVLSAHQALTSTDLALLRIICAIEARQVIIFVNRIDELTDPLAETDRIRSSILRTLGRSGLSQDIQILFGSGQWAQAGIGGIGKLSATSRDALDAWWAGRAGTDRPELPEEAAYLASGVPDLHRAIADRITEGPGQAVLRDVRADLARIEEMGRTVVRVAGRRRQGDAAQALDLPALRQELAAGAARVHEDFERDVAAIRIRTQGRFERAHAAFVDAAVEALQAHIDTFGENSRWICEPSSLRMALRSSYISATAALRPFLDTAVEDMLDGVHVILERDLGIYNYADRIEFPELPEAPSPALLARTLSLDLHAGWWNRFLRIGRKNSAEKRYRSMIHAETAALTDELLVECFDRYAAELRAILTAFSKEQIDFVDAVMATIKQDQPPAGAKAAARTELAAEQSRSVA